METKIVVVAYTEYKEPDKGMQDRLQAKVDEALKNAGEGWRVRSVESRIAASSGIAAGTKYTAYTMADPFTVFLFTIILEK